MEEPRCAVAEMANHKSPGPDGLSTEIFKQYGDILLLELLNTLNQAFSKGHLPPSMMEATIIIIPKEGKDQLDPASYRPISLLCTNVKILAKVLATRLKGCIERLIHPDQSGFIPNRSTSLNIRRVFLNIQIPTDNETPRALLALDAAKAFDSLEWSYLWRTLEGFGFGPSY